jgi:SAM-dependent methyltransferase
MRAPTAFTAHNIRLSDGSLTIPGLDWEMSQHPLFLATKRAVGAVFPGGHEGRRIVDLGCLEGGYTVEFARMGLDALGIEVRSSNLVNCLYVKEDARLLNLTFAHDDAWNLENYGTFDIIFCSGLLYHLDQPRRFVDLLFKACGRLLVLNTHYATHEATDKFALSDLTENEGLTGRWFIEYEDAETRREDTKWAAWDNRRSFWPFKEHLVDALRSAGFTAVLEDPVASEPASLRTTLIAFR